MKTILLSIASVCLLVVAVQAESDFEQGMNWYGKRSEGAQGFKAKAEPINNAIQYFEMAYNAKENELESGIYLMRSYIYKGRFVLEDNAAKREVFEKAKMVGEQLVPRYPKNKELRFENLTAVGLWGERLGIFKAASEGIADRVKTEIETLVELDPEFRNAIGQRALGVLHLMAPKIPFIMTWPDDAYGLELTKSVVTRYPNDIGNNFFYAQALVDNGKKKDAIPYLEKALNMQPEAEYLLEDRHFHMRAKKLLKELTDS
ncbi:MAG: hypothetical protein RL266_428 [Bacteroidota bacterium]|jgi:tetratricopeptide (TPR) repeat protein